MRFFNCQSTGSVSAKEMGDGFRIYTAKKQKAFDKFLDGLATITGIKFAIWLGNTISDEILKNNSSSQNSRSLTLAEDINRVFNELPWRANGEAVKTGISIGFTLSPTNARNILQELKNSTNPQDTAAIRDGLIAGVNNNGLPSTSRSAITNEINRIFPSRVPSPAPRENSSIAVMPEFRPDITQVRPPAPLGSIEGRPRPTGPEIQMPGFERPSIYTTNMIGNTTVTFRYDNTIDRSTGRPIGLVADIGNRRGVDVWNTYGNDPTSPNKAGKSVIFNNRQTVIRNINGRQETLPLSNGSFKLASNALYIDTETNEIWYLLESTKGGEPILVQAKSFSLE